jgi:hypothetical protein
MNMRAGGAAVTGTPDTPETVKDIRTAHLRNELEEARKRSLVTNAQYALLLRDSGADLERFAQAAEDAALAAGRVAGLVRMLARSLAPALVLLVL